MPPRTLRACRASHFRLATSPSTTTSPPTRTSSPGPPIEGVGARAADQHVIAGATGDAVVPGTAHQHVVAVAALEIDSGRSGEHRGVDDVLTGEGCHDGPVDRGVVGVQDPDPRAQAVDPRRRAGSRHRDDVVPGGALHANGVGRRVGGLPSGDGGQIGDDLGGVRARQVVHGHLVRSSERMESDLLEVVQVHHHVRHVASEPQPSAVGRDVDPLARAAAVEDHPVGPRLAFDDVVAVARIPLELSLPAPRNATSSPRCPSMTSAPSPPSRMSAPSLPRMPSLPAPPSTVSRISAARPLPASTSSSPAAGVEHQVLAGADVDGEGRRGDAVEPDPSAVGGDGEALRARAAVDLDGVGARAALVQIGVVTGVPDHPVVPALAEHLIVGVAAGEDVVLGAPEQQVDAAAAEQGVVAGLTEELVGSRPRRSGRRCPRRRTGCPRAARRWLRTA